MRKLTSADVSTTHLDIGPRQARVYDRFDAVNDENPLKTLRNLGIRFGVTNDKVSLHLNHWAKEIAGGAMDTLQPTVTTPSIIVPIQFLQAWLPGWVAVITQALKIDTLIGILNAGSWEDAEVVQEIQELTGNAMPYGDTSNIPFSSWNTNYLSRSVVRMEEGFQSFILEAARAARIRQDDGGNKRAAAAKALEISRNTIGFYGYNLGGNATYGMLNDPNQLGYNTIPTGLTGSTEWATKDYLEIIQDIMQMLGGLQTQSGDQVDLQTTPMTLALPLSVDIYLGRVAQYGQSVKQWLNETYPKIRTVSVPQFDGANGGANVAYLFAERVSNDGSTDGGAVWVQPVPQKIIFLGLKKDVKNYVEDFSNATAGALMKRPWGQYTITGV